MSTYFFETITDAQASTFNAATDTLVFGQTGERANITTVRYNPATATSAATITLISGLTGKTVTFNAAVANDTAGNQPIFLPLALAANPVPLKGGTLVPNPILLIVSGLVSSGSGTFEMPVAGAASASAHVTLQCIVKNGSVYEFSNALDAVIGY